MKGKMYVVMFYVRKPFLPVGFLINSSVVDQEQALEAAIPEKVQEEQHGCSQEGTSVL